MAKVTFLLIFGATFLPGFLSDPFHPKSAYSIEVENLNPIKYETDQLISYELVPLKSNTIRKKRQISSITLNTPEPSDEVLPNLSAIVTKKPILPDQKLNSDTHVWMNKTRDLPVPSTALDGKPSVGKLPGLGGKEGRLGQVLTNSVPPTDNGTGNSSTKQVEVNLTQNPLEYDFHYPDFPPEASANISANITIDRQQDDDFKYYNTTYLSDGSAYWMDLSKSAKHEMLSNAHRRAATLKPKFEFPFYGHPIFNLTVATGGFIYLGDQVHAWLAATQYVAPLMANFDSSSSENATVSYVSEDNYFIVEWHGVLLQDSPGKGPFTFQTTLYKNGTIVFAYKSIPIPVKDINDTNHPVKIGLSDAYIRDRNVFVIKQKTIYEYHRIDLKEHYEFEIGNNSAIIFTPQETCHQLKTCELCTQSDVFDCAWCPKISTCSDGFFRQRQDWIQNHCDKEVVQVQHWSECAASVYNVSSTPSTYLFPSGKTDHTHGSGEVDHDHFTPETSQIQKVRTADSEGTSTGGVITILFFVMVVFSSIGWLVYAYLYPHTPSGQLLIRYRPTQWAFRRGEARYTAASIHM